MIGQMFGHYKVVAKIGAGGMGVVYRAHDEQLDRDVALKVLTAGVLGNDVSRKLFRKEALALAKLNHPNIETIFEFSSQGDIDYLAMELVPGEPLDERLIKGPLPEPELLRLATQFADALAAAHESGVIHRDLKPANIFVTPDERLKILDFGLAKLTQPGSHPEITQSVTMASGSVSGTVPYMSPEQLRGLPVDVRSDVYSAGAVLYEMATGKRPYPQEQTAELMGAILLQPLAPASSINPDISPKLERVISKALEKDPNRRFQTARELRAALGAVSLPPTVTFNPTEMLEAPDFNPASESAASPPPPSASRISSVSAAPPPAYVSAPAPAPVSTQFPAQAASQSTVSWKPLIAVLVLAVLVVAIAAVGLNAFGLRDRLLSRDQVTEKSAQPSLTPDRTPSPAAAPPASSPPSSAPAKTVSTSNPEAVPTAPGKANRANGNPNPAPSAASIASGREADALHSAGVTLAESGNLADARAKFERALELERSSGDRKRSAVELNSLANVLNFQGDLRAGKKDSEDGVAAGHEIGDNALVSSALANEGDALAGLGDTPTALSKYEQSLAMTRVLGDAPAQAHDFLGLARVRYTDGDLAGAKKWIDEAEPALRKSADKSLAGLALAYTGDILAAQGDTAGAHAAYDKALKSLNAAGATRYAAETEVAAARLSVDEGNADDAKPVLRAALAKLRENNDLAGEIVAHAVLVRALLAKGGLAQFAEAQKQVNIGASRVSPLQDPQPRLELTISAARAAAALGAFPKARVALEDAIAEAGKYQFFRLNYEARLALGEIEANSGKTGAARFRLRALEKDATEHGYLLIARRAQASLPGVAK
jgi:serine/threonine protein kinase/predicted negative regulator of RcsB-dependent stress response